MSSDDPSSAEYANEQELNRIAKVTEESQAAAEAHIAEAKAQADAAAAAVQQQQEAAISESFATMKENNAPAREALAALHAGEPIQDGELPPPEDFVPPEPAESPPPPAIAEPPHPEQLPS